MPNKPVHHEPASFDSAWWQAEILRELTRVREQFEELILMVRQPVDAVAKGENSDFFTRLAQGALRARCLMHLMQRPHEETFAVALEAFAGLAAQDPGLYERHTRMVVSGGLVCLERLFAVSTGLKASSGKYVRAMHRSLVYATHVLHVLMGKKGYADYTALCVAYPLRASNVDTPCALRLRGLDLERVKAQGLHVYLVEYPLALLEERGLRLGYMLGNLGKSGVVFAMKPCEFAGEAVLCTLFGTTLARDYVEAITRLRAERIYSVNMAQLSKRLPSWERRFVQGSLLEEAQSSAENPQAQAGASLSSTEELLRLYDEAMQAQFEEARATPDFVPLDSSAYA